MLLTLLNWFGLDLVLSVAWSLGDQLVVFFCSRISVLFHTLEIFICHNTLFSVIPNFWLIKGLIRDLLDSCVDTLMG